MPLGPPMMAGTVLRFCVPTVRRRYEAASTRDADGCEVLPAPTGSTIMVHAWPSSGDPEHLPEGWEARDVIEGNSPDDLRTHDEQAGLRADEIVWQGDVYEILSVGPWQGGPTQGSQTFVAFTAGRVVGRPAVAP